MTRPWLWDFRTSDDVHCQRIRRLDSPDLPVGKCMATVWQEENLLLHTHLSSRNGSQAVMRSRSCRDGALCPRVLTEVGATPGLGGLTGKATTLIPLWSVIGDVAFLDITLLEGREPLIRARVLRDSDPIRAEDFKGCLDIAGLGRRGCHTGVRTAVSWLPEALWVKGWRTPPYTCFETHL